MAKLVLVTEDLTDAQFANFVAFFENEMSKNLGWTIHKVVGEDVPDDRNGHILKLSFAETGNPPGGK